VVVNSYWLQQANHMDNMVIEGQTLNCYKSGVLLGIIVQVKIEKNEKIKNIN
jgi:hypothetical protein